MSDFVYLNFETDNPIIKTKAIKVKTDLNDEKIFYKYETEYFLQKADYFFDYKLTGGIYDSSSIYINNYNNELQYMKVLFIKKQKFFCKKNK